MFTPRKYARADFIAILGHGLGDRGFQIGVCFHMPRHSPGGQPQEIVKDKNLPVAPRPGTDSYRRNFKPFCDSRGSLGRYALQHDGECPGRLGRPGVCQKLLFVALSPISAHLVNVLRRNPQWAITGMPAETRALTTSACSAPHSSFTAWQCVSFKIRPALSMALYAPR